MKGLRAPTQEQAGVLIAMVAVLFGGWVRLFIPWIAGFPVNDGGLFYVMLRAVHANGLRIPLHISYNGLSIPFAYPPLGFYVGAIVADLFRVDAIKVLQWLPATVLVGTLPAFYVLARAVLGTSFRAGLATLMFAFTPRAITWQVMGGGLTRSFGQLFLILALAAIYLTFDRFSRKRLILAILFSALVVLSHPEAALQTVGIAILLWIFKGRTQQGTLHALEIGTGTLALTSVWWLPAINHFGAGTLLSAAQTGQHNLLTLLAPFLLNFVDEPLITLVAVLGLIGFAFEASRRRPLIPIWFFVPFLIEPRSAPTYAMIPLAMLAGISLGEIVLPGLARVPGDAARNVGVNIMRCAPVVIFLAFIGIYMFAQTSYYGVQVAGTSLSADTRAAFGWIKTNAPPGSRFLVLTGNTSAELFCDAPVEWFPALAERTSVSTIQGREWEPGNQFGTVAANAQAASACLTADSPLACIEKLTSTPGSPLAYNYLYVARTAPVISNCRATGVSRRGEVLIGEMNASARYTQVYGNKEAAVFVEH